MPNLPKLIVEAVDLDVIRHIFSRGDVLVIGEAAGLISPSTGEGISYALRSAKACAEAINNAKSFSEAKEQYLQNVDYLVNDIKDKIQRARVLMSILSRKELFKHLQA